MTRCVLFYLRDMGLDSSDCAFQNSQMTVVHLRCPAGVSCALVDMWNMQVSALRHVVESDTIQWVGK